MTEDSLELRVLKIFSEHDACDEVWWRTDGEYAPVTFLVNCNDLFYWGCADAEPVTKDNIDNLEGAYSDAVNASKDGEIYAHLLFCCRAREMRPQGAYYDHIPKEMWSMLDACGEDRETGLGNPKPRPS
jgi:hypothetical protein